MKHDVSNKKECGFMEHQHGGEYIRSQSKDEGPC
jgi:hypothetical protein